MQLWRMRVKMTDSVDVVRMLETCEWYSDEMKVLTGEHCIKRSAVASIIRFVCRQWPFGPMSLCLSWRHAFLVLTAFTKPFHQ